MCLLSFHLNALFGLTPVAIYPTVKLNEKGLNKLAEARKSGTVKMPALLAKKIKNARTDTGQSFSERH
jgi:hypothetical protein